MSRFKRYGYPVSCEINHRPFRVTAFACPFACCSSRHSQTAMRRKDAGTRSSGLKARSRTLFWCGVSFPRRRYCTFGSVKSTQSLLAWKITFRMWKEPCTGNSENGLWQKDHHARSMPHRVAGLFEASRWQFTSVRYACVVSIL